MKIESSMVLNSAVKRIQSVNEWCIIQCFYCVLHPKRFTVGGLGVFSSTTTIFDWWACFSDITTVSCEELQQHKNFLKVTKKQEKDLKDSEKKFQKKREELIQKYSDQFKALKKKSVGKK